MNQVQLLLGIAQQAAGQGQPGPAGCGGGNASAQIMMFGLMAVVFYFMMIRPQQKKMNEHKKLLDGLKKGDQVITRGGLVAKISGIQDNMVILEVQEKVRVQVLRSYIEGIYQRSADPTAVKVETPAESKN